MDGKPQVSNLRLVSFPVSEKKKKKKPHVGKHASIFSLFWENFCKFIETQSHRCLRSFPGRSHGDRQLPARLGPGHGQSGLRGDDFNTAPLRQPRGGGSGAGADPQRRPRRRGGHPGFPKTNPSPAAAFLTALPAPRCLPPLHLRRAGAARRAPRPHGGPAHAPRPRPPPPPPAGLRL